MACQNRVTPLGELVASDARGTLMGNRGCLVDRAGRIARHHRGHRWIICLLEFKGRWRPVMQPGRWTELFFLDEATALAAGHRPCAECRRERYEAYRRAWAVAKDGGLPSAVEMDEVLQQERWESGGRRTHPTEMADLPAGAMVRIPGEADIFLVTGTRLLTWSPHGYGAGRRRECRPVELITPPSTVEALRAGYRPILGIR